MLIITIKKLLAKRWMFFCILLGCVLLIATTISLPLYENATYDKLLQDQFKLEYESTGIWPATYHRMFFSQSNTQAADLFVGEELLANMGEVLRVTTKDTIRLYKTVDRRLSSTMNRDDDSAHEKIQISMLSDLENHMDLLGGRLFSEDGYTEEGYLETVITMEAMLDYGYLVGEVLEFQEFKGNGTERLKMQIVGIVEAKKDDIYWDVCTEELNNACFISESAFDGIFLGTRVNDFFITCFQSYLFEYEDLQSEQVKSILSVIEDETYEGSRYETILKDYEAKRFRISATLLILQIPMLLLLGAFLTMISGQMYMTERNEIAVIKSRGSSSNQLFRMYFYQISIVVLIGLLFGIPLGCLFLQMLGSASGFLEFGIKRSLTVDFNGKVLIYLLIAVMLIVGIMSVPAIRQSKLSIVHSKQHYSRKKKSFWERCFLDIICLVVGGYGYHFFSENEDGIAASVLLNEPLNPLLYISSTVLIVGMGLLFLRLLPLVVAMVYRLGEKRWKPATYATFLEIMRSSRKQHFVMLFLIMNIAFGIYHATVAQTITDNAYENTMYLNQADVIIGEKWRDNSLNAALDDLGSDAMHFYEGDYARFQTLDGVESYTKVYYDDTDTSTRRIRAQVWGVETNMMLVHPKEFGEMTWVDRELLDEHYYNYLNMLVDHETGFIISRNLAEHRKLEVGNAITLQYQVYMLEKGDGADYEALQMMKFTGRVLAIVDYWPGYKPTNTYVDETGKVYERANYLVVGSYIPFEKSMNKEMKPQPYEVWIDMEDDTDTYHVGDWINAQDMKILKYRNQQRIMNLTMTDPLLQGTCGILTMEFVVTILLCGVGYLVYWVMSIRDRELMFGIFRAFGMYKGELFGMLALEQLLSGVLAAFVGIGIGKFVCKLFAPMMLLSYSAAQQVLPMKLTLDLADELRLYGAIGFVMVLCMIVLIRFVFKMNVAESLKLGED